jgi:mannose-6-phosphate isomerase-like protein (cupin superfamily)
MVCFVWRVLGECEWNVDQERIDVFKQELIVVEINTCFKHNNTQIILSLYQQQYFVFYI